ncbi:MAG: GGDEF domain-containing protein [Pseudomonadota bacterium]
MIAAWLKLPEWARVGVACLVCLGLFTLDMSSVDMNESQLYPLAMLPLYRIRTRSLLWIICGLAIVLTIAGYMIAPPPDIWKGLANRGFSLVVIGVTMLGMDKLADHEHQLLIESMTDPLTGLLNRRYFTKLSPREVARSLRHGLWFSVLMLDIDHFKRINDNFGHPVGDLAIKALAEICNQALRPHDVLARYGGEEFVLTLPHTDEEGTNVVAERIRKAVEQLELASASGPVRFTVSIGVSIYKKNLSLDGSWSAPTKPSTRPSKAAVTGLSACLSRRTWPSPPRSTLAAAAHSVGEAVSLKE